MLAAGIDLSGRTTGTTALAWVGGDPPRLVRLESGKALRRDAELVAHLSARRPGLVGIDAPLTLPHAVTCANDDCAICFPADGSAPFTGSRDVDRREAWAKIGHVEKAPMPSALLAGIAYRAIYVARLLAKQGIEAIETWPMGVYRVLARPTPTDDTGDAWRRRLLKARVAGLAETDGTDRLDAIAAAYAAWCKLANRAVAVTGEGSIWVPER